MKKSKWILIFGIAVFLIVSLFAGWHRMGQIPLASVEITGLSPEHRPRIEKVLNSQVGQPMSTLRTHVESEKLTKDPWVASAEVRRKFPNVLEVKIQERIPIAVAGDGSGKFFYVDAQNNLIDKATEDKLNRYPVLLGVGFIADKTVRERAVDLLKSLPESGNLSRSSISEIDFQGNKGFLLHLNSGKTVIRLGNDQLALRLDRSGRVLDYLRSHQIDASFLDAEYGKKVLVKVRKPR